PRPWPRFWGGTRFTRWRSKPSGDLLGHGHAQDQEDHEDDQRQDSQEFGDARRRARDPAETQQTGDKGDDGEDERPFQHVGNLRFSPQANEPREMEVPPDRKATPLS